MVAGKSTVAAIPDCFFYSIHVNAIEYQASIEYYGRVLEFLFIPKYLLKKDLMSCSQKIVHQSYNLTFNRRF